MFGTRVGGTTDTENTQGCESCDGSYELENSRCVQDCVTDDFVEKLIGETPNVLGCNAESIEVATSMYFDDLLNVNISISTLVTAFPNATVTDLLYFVTTINLVDAQLESSFLVLLN